MYIDHNKLFFWIVIIIIIILVINLWCLPNKKVKEHYTDRIFRPNDNKFDDDEFFQYNSDSDDPSGMQKCLEKCYNPGNGICVEYGLSGSAWCYKYYEGQSDDFEKEIKRKKEISKQQGELVREWHDSLTIR